MFLDVGADDAGAGEIFLGAGGDVGEHGLDALEALMDAAAEVLDDDAGDGQGQEGDQRELGADGQHEDEGSDGEDQGVGRIHDGGAEQHADGVEVVGGAGHDVAGAVALVVGVGETLKVGEEVVAEVEFDVSADADDYVAGEELEDAFEEGDADDEQAIGEELLAGDAGVESVDGATDDLREKDPDAVVEENRVEPGRRAAF